MAGWVTWETVGSSDYRERLANGWRDTGHHKWYDVEIEAAMMVRDGDDSDAWQPQG